MRNTVTRVGAFFRVVCLLAVVCGFRNEARADAVRRPHIEVEIVSDVTEVVPDVPFNLALRLKPLDGWHVYWKYHGDSGQPPKIAWQLPQGLRLEGELAWPYPKRFPVQHLVNFGYDRETLLVQRAVLPSVEGDPGSLVIKGTASWLVCLEECIPGSTDLSLSLPVHSGPPTAGVPAASRWRDAFEAAAKLVPPSVQDLYITRTVDESGIAMKIVSRAGRDLPTEGVQFFPDLAGWIKNAAPQQLSKDGAAIVLKLAPGRRPNEAKDYFAGVLYAPSGWPEEGEPKAVSFQLGTPPKPTPAPVSASSAPMPVSQTDTGLLEFLLLAGSAFVGGLILNLMPCVFPVISLKILGFVEQSGSDARTIRLHGLLFAAGVLVSFWVLAGALLILKSFGLGLGWGFQLQYPGFVAMMILIVFVIALNLMGWFEFGARLQNLAGNVKTHEGLVSSFMNGVLACVLATPCTAPFMGAAIAASLGMPAYLSMLIFTALALGMAAPYVLLSFMPKLLRFLPRPGTWMVLFKEFMSFPLYGTVIWLLWVYGKQTGIDTVTRMLFGLLGVAALLWIYDLLSQPRQKLRTRRIAALAALVGLLYFGYYVYPRKDDMASAGHGGADKYVSHGVEWERYSSKRLDELRAQGIPVYLDFTAAWCITCQVNKQVVFSSSDVTEKLKKEGFVLLQGDWTSSDPEITAALQRFGRSGVPLNVVYGRKAGGEPIVLPSILTSGIVLNALDQALRR